MSVTDGISKAKDVHKSFADIRTEYVTMTTLSTTNNDIAKIDRKLVSLFNSLSSVLVNISRSQYLARANKPEWFTNFDID